RIQPISHPLPSPLFSLSILRLSNALCVSFPVICCLYQIAAFHRLLISVRLTSICPYGAGLSRPGAACRRFSCLACRGSCSCVRPRCLPCGLSCPGRGICAGCLFLTVHDAQAVGDALDLLL